MSPPNIDIPKKHIIAVDIWQPDERGFTPAGVAVYDQSVRLGGFQYYENYDGPPLDPVNLDYERNGNLFRLPRGSALHSAFQDQLPGVTAQQLIQMKIPRFIGLNDAAKISALGAYTSGALRFRPKDAVQVDEKPIRGLRTLDRMIRGQIKSLSDGYSGPPALAEAAWYSATHVRGQRPKSLYVNHSGQSFIAKFGKPDDPFRIERTEQAMLNMARDCGIQAVISQIETTPAGHDVLFVSRFDETAEGRNHRLSLAALTGIENPGEGDFLDIRKILYRISSNPEEDNRELFRRMMLHNAVHNSDNHFRNFDMLLTENGWRLAPAYDITPDPARHPFATTMCGQAQQDFSEDFIRHAAQQFELPQDEAMGMARDVLSVVADKSRYFEAVGLSLADQKLINRAIPVSDLLALLDRLPQKSGVEVSYGL